jgi:hypothetical protein
MEEIGQLHAPTDLPPEEQRPVPIEQETGLVLALVWMLCWRERPVAPGGRRTTTPQSSARSLVALSHHGFCYSYKFRKQTRPIMYLYTFLRLNFIEI